MSAKHTPGPLYVGNDRDEDGFSYYYVGPENEQAARVYYDDSDEASGDQALADAMLYAAAPDLLEALKGLHDDVVEYVTLNKLHDADGSPAINNHWIQRARAAIAKATGAPQCSPPCNPSPAPPSH